LQNLAKNVQRPRDNTESKTDKGSPGGWANPEARESQSKEPKLEPEPEGSQQTSKSHGAKLKL